VYVCVCVHMCVYGGLSAATGVRSQAGGPVWTTWQTDLTARHWNGTSGHKVSVIVVLAPAESKGMQASV